MKVLSRTMIAAAGATAGYMLHIVIEYWADRHHIHATSPTSTLERTERRALWPDHPDLKLVIKRNYDNHPTDVRFIAPVPIAANTLVGYGVNSAGSRVGSFSSDLEYNPYMIEDEDTMDLIDSIIHNVRGVAAEIYAKDYELIIQIAESNLDRQQKIIDGIAEIIQTHVMRYLC